MRLSETAVIQHIIRFFFTMDSFDEKIMSNFKVGIIGICTEGRRKHDLEIKSSIKQRIQL